MKTAAMLAIAILLMTAVTADRGSRVVPIHAAGKVGHVSQPSPSAARPLPSTLLTAFHAGNPGSRRHLREDLEESAAASPAVVATTVAPRLTGLPTSL